MVLLWSIFILIVCLLFASIIFYKYTIDAKKSQKRASFQVQPTQIPRIIWSYWESTELPDIIKRCVHSWQKHNPNTRIHVLNKDTYKHFVDKDITSYKMNDSPARFSDFLRLELLSKYGGIWIDSSTILNASLDWVYDMQQERNAEFVGFYIPNFTTTSKYPVIESWFLASPQNSTFIHLWNKEMRSINDYDTADQYVEKALDQKVDLQNIPQQLRGYLAIHVAVQKIMQKQYPHFNITVKNASEKEGPFYYLNANSWETDVALQKLCYDQDYRTPVVKLRGDERNYIESKASLSMKECIFR